MKQNNNHKAFTLIELLLVIAILGILSTIGFFAFQRSQLRGRDSRRKNDLSQIAKALEMYANDAVGGAFPVGSGGKIMGCGTAGTTACTWGQPFSKGSGNSAAVYMQVLPKDPAADFQYYYVSKTGTLGVPSGYLLYAYLENTDDPLRTDIAGTNCSSTGTRLCNYVHRSANITPIPTP